MSNDKTKCADCNVDLAEEKNGIRKPCPKCGSKKRIIDASLHDGFKMNNSLRGQAKNPNYTGKRKWRWDSFTGWEQSHLLGKLVKKERLIDKDKNLYKETVIDPDTNEILHSCEEPLNKHISHGSAKPKKPRQKPER